MELILGAIFGFLAAVLWRYAAPPMLLFRPGLEWTPEANVDDPFKREAYIRAGKNLGVRVKLGPPVPCPGYSLCGDMTGIWLHREDAEKLERYQFVDEMWKEHSRITA